MTPLKILKLLTAMSSALRVLRRKVDPVVTVTSLLILIMAGVGFAMLGGRLLLISDSERNTVQSVHVLTARNSDSPYRVINDYLHTMLVSWQESFPEGIIAIGNRSIRIDSRPESGGSLDTLSLIEEFGSLNGRGNRGNASSKVGIGIAQSDVLYHYIRGGHPQLVTGRSASSIRSIERAFSEWIHVYAKQGKVESIEALSPVEPIGRFGEICVGEGDGASLGSGHLISAMNLMRVVGGVDSNLYACRTPFGEISDNYDFRIGVWSPPRRPIDDNEIVVGLSDSLSRILARAYPGIYKPIENSTLIAKFNSRTQGANTQTEYMENSNRTTVSVDGVWIANQSTDPIVVRAVIDIVRSLEIWICQPNGVPPVSVLGRRIEYDETELASLSNSIKSSTLFCDFETPEFGGVQNQNVQGNSRFGGLPIAKHATVTLLELDPISRWFADLNISWAQGVMYLLLSGFILIPVSSGFVHHFAKMNRIGALSSMVAGRNQVFSSIRRWTIPVIVFGVFHVVVAILIWLAELNSEALLVDPAFVSAGIPNAIVWVASFVATVNGEINFYSPMSLFWVGTLKAGWAVTGVLVTVQAGSQVFEWLTKDINMNHVVIVGWNAHGKRVVTDLEQQNRGIKIFGFLDEKSIEEQCRPDYNRIEDLEELFRDPDWPHAAAIIILADRARASHKEDEDVDLWVYHVIKRIKEYSAKKADSAGPYVIAEVLRERNRELAVQAGADEVVCVQSFGSEILAQAATRRGISDVFTRLVGTSDETNEVYFDRPKADYDDKPFSHAATSYLNSMDPVRRKGLVIGIKRNHMDGSHEILLNPDRDLKVDCNSDEFIVIARSELGE